ncbi:MAG: hypothetical protein WEB60_05755 [Terrimicrobiaceae bacterium]
MLTPAARPHPFSIPQAPVPPGYSLRDVQLELSLKPFWDNSDETRDGVCREMFTQWLPLLRYAESVSVMLLLGDGSEILEYRGDLSQEMEWARYIGTANPLHWPPVELEANPNPDHEGIGRNVAALDPERKDTHQHGYLYRPNPPQFTYAWLAGLVAALKRIGAEVTGKRILVGDIFDIGPEFAKSKFKYEWHREILGKGALFGGQFVSCEAVLGADKRVYAGYPTGIPEGTPFGAFLGRQTRRFFEDCGLDFLWLSNGFGFGLEPWSLVGQVFDGLRFDQKNAPAVSARILKFWENLRSELPTKYRIRTRGTNFGAGTDLSSDASPLREIYAGGFALDAPVNSPWASIDQDIGVELSGWMARIAQRPGDGYRFRFYIHDPWWMNSPWLDRFERSPHELVIPGAVSRLKADGTAEPPCDVAFLSVDDSYGRLPPQVPNEVIPQLLRVREFIPDGAGPLVWVYPFDDFHDYLIGEGAPHPELPIFGDWFARSLINEGIPLNQVADAVEFAACVHSGCLPVGIVPVSPVPRPGSVHEAALQAHVKAGGDVLLYGPLNPESEITAALGVTLAEPLEGDFQRLGDDRRMIRHTATFSGGPWREKAGTSLTDCLWSASAISNNQERLAGLVRRTASGGRWAWLRGSLTTAEFDPANPKPILGPLLKSLPRTQFFPSERFAHEALGALGWSFHISRENEDARAPFTVFHRHRNALIAGHFFPAPHVGLSLKTPLGAPLFVPAHNHMVEGRTVIPHGPAGQRECRWFVEDQDSGTIRVRLLHPGMPHVRRRYLLSGMDHATIRFLPEPDTGDALRILIHPVFPYFLDEVHSTKIEDSPWGPLVTVHDVSGELLFEW